MPFFGRCRLRARLAVRYTFGYLVNETPIEHYKWDRPHIGRSNAGQPPPSLSSVVTTAWLAVGRCHSTGEYH